MIVVRIHLAAQLCHLPAIDRRPAGHNDLFAGAAGSHSGIRQKFLKAYHGDVCEQIAASSGQIK
jgi:hypothetical protein